MMYTHLYKNINFTCGPHVGKQIVIDFNVVNCYISNNLQSRCKLICLYAACMVFQQFHHDRCHLSWSSSNYTGFQTISTCLALHSGC